MNNEVICMDGTFFYNHREIMFAEVLEDYDLINNKTIKGYKTGKKVVTYYPNKNGLIENVATGELYIYGNVMFDGTDTFIKPYKGTFIKREYYNVAVKSLILTQEDKQKYDKYIKENNITSYSRQKKLYDNLLSEKGCLLLSEWIKQNINDEQEKTSKL